jgi:hypothetical protein
MVTGLTGFPMPDNKYGRAKISEPENGEFFRFFDFWRYPTF